VCRIANFLKQEGVRAGDVVTLYLPTTPDLAACMLACARIGAIHRYTVLTLYTHCIVYTATLCIHYTVYTEFMHAYTVDQHMWLLQCIVPHMSAQWCAQFSVDDCYQYTTPILLKSTELLPVL
jgi:non-ribosomal peptide synthetase component E (peptide arylation enzyme)